MADPSRRRDTAGVGADRASPPRMPRWVKWSLILAGVIALAVVIAMLLGGGGHGPSRHAPGIQLLPSSVTADLASSGGLGGLAASEVSQR